MAFQIKQEWAKRPVWLNIVLLFCLYMTFIYSPFDVLFKSVATDEDVWLGLVFHGWQAKVGGVMHWLVYGALAWGLWHMTSWAWWLGSIYATQVMLAMFLWPVFTLDPPNWTGGVIAGLLFALPAIAFWRSRALFQSA